MTEIDLALLVIQLTSMEDTEKIEIHVPRLLMCGDCGVLPSNTNECTGCGGYAQPSPNQLLATKPVKA